MTKPLNPASRGERRGVALSELQSLRLRLCFMILLVDCLSIFVGCVLGNVVRFGDPLAASGINLFAVVLPIYVGISINSDAFGAEVLADMRTGLSRAWLAFMFAVFAVFFLTFYMRASSDVSRMTSSVAILTTLFTLGIGRYACRAM